MKMFAIWLGAFALMVAAGFVGYQATGGDLYAVGTWLPPTLVVVGVAAGGVWYARSQRRR